MNTTITRAAGLLSIIGISMGLVHAAYAPGINLYMSGGLVSSRVIQHNGVAYAPIVDMAKALNQIVEAKADGYAITPAGGANQVSGLNGKLGDKLTDGALTLSVVKAFRTDKNKLQFMDGYDIDPVQSNDSLVVVVLHCKNRLNVSVQINSAGNDNTALTDQDDHAYRAVTCDTRHFPNMLPGSACDFVLLYSVPKNEKIGDLVYQTYYFSGGAKNATFRISLASANP